MLSQRLDEAAALGAELRNPDHFRAVPWDRKLLMVWCRSNEKFEEELNRNRATSITQL